MSTILVDNYQIDYGSINNFGLPNSEVVNTPLWKLLRNKTVYNFEIGRMMNFI
jgi:hypothetical protein